METHEKDIKCELYHDNFQNWKSYNIPKAQLVIADIPYNLGENAYASNPTWYVGGDNSNGESDKAGKAFFHTDGRFKIAEYMHFCSKLLVKFNWFTWERETNYPKIHPTQKPVYLLRQLIEIFTDAGDVVIDPCAGSASTLVAARECGRHSYGFEVDKKFYTLAKEKMLSQIQLMIA